VPNIEYFVFYRLPSNLYLLQHTDVIHRHRTSVFPDKHLIYKSAYSKSQLEYASIKKTVYLSPVRKQRVFLSPSPKGTY